MKPAHVGLIPDGLRRWAHANGTSLTDAYRRGADKVVEILLALQRNDVQTVTVYNLSRANLARPGHELDAVYAASAHFLSTLIPEHFDPADCGLRIHGDLSLLPDEIAATARAAQTAMAGDGFRINVLLAYDAADELRAAHQRALREGCDITAAFEISDIDLVLRTTAEPLLSGFPPLQSQYAQLMFLDTPLNELTAAHIDDLVEQYRAFPQRRGK
ncbi:undecaprenyl diphosphate synthase family protein [Mycobacterium sp. ITM-2016-00317]|uniref:undecaprenyl diphosphate synthase family protein n=1 Tax=Mycobacterium sp. ITM-2016-00317 TaxID=2099694 RepID=UPI00287F4949|nr:undecaprenyl diphosphate synthase family protein [Mycobacterium sp. ITM-2016-00317]WNG88970.1 undecaprenyl diphosphate synthase family protein [Mycobacterium sp. ITM-2016-00317]